MVKATGEYWLFILQLRNRLREYFFNQEIIDASEHVAFMRKNWDNYYVYLDDNRKPAGWVGVVDGDIRVAVSPEFQKLGIASFMLEHIKRMYPDAKAQILESNTASIKLFESAKIPMEII